MDDTNDKTPVMVSVRVSEASNNRMRRAASWLEANGVDWALYDMQNDVISFGHLSHDSDRLRRVHELCKGLTADVRTDFSTAGYSIEPTAERFGFRWYVWTKRHVAEPETVVIE